jgi:hypothetical protein
MAMIVLTTNGDSLMGNGHLTSAFSFMRYAAPEHQWVLDRNDNGGRNLPYGKAISTIQGSLQPRPSGLYRIYYVMLKTYSAYNIGANQAERIANDMLDIRALFSRASVKKTYTHYWASTVFATGTNATTPDTGRCDESDKFNIALRAQLPSWGGLGGLPASATYQVIDPAALVMPNDTVPRSRLDPAFPSQNMNSANLTVYGSRAMYADSLHPLTSPLSRDGQWATPAANDRLGGYGTDWQTLALVRRLCTLIGLTNPPPLWGVSVF